jgi:hypothetical protein
MDNIHATSGRVKAPSRWVELVTLSGGTAACSLKIEFSVFFFYVCRREKINFVSGRYPTMGLGSIEAVTRPIDVLFGVNTINRMTMLLFLIARKRLVCSLTCESGMPY